MDKPARPVPVPGPEKKEEPSVGRIPPPLLANCGCGQSCQCGCQGGGACQCGGGCG